MVKETLYSIYLDAHYANILPFFYIISVLWVHTDIHEYISVFHLILIYLWQLCLGLRDIITHQIIDRVNDEKSGTLTFVRMVPEDVVNNINCLILPLIELFLFAVLLVELAHITPLPFIAYLVYLIVMLRHIHTVWKWQVGFPPHHYYPAHLLNNFYNDWFPLLIIVMAVIYGQYSMLLLLLIHIICFGIPKGLPGANKEGVA